MEKIGLNKLREMFLSFYEEKEHYRRKSFSLVPDGDKSLLLINSGMAPLKPFFAGTETPPAKRMTTCQKCIRTGDIENVGQTARHATFFEMLGSFSFGDYFKEESLVWGWEFSTEVLKMPKEKIWASIYEEDEEAYAIWRDIIKFPEERIVRLGKDDNYWEIGVGPCGPCSEMYYDRGEKYGCDNPNCKPGCECDRYVEFWNHVFTQFSKDENGNYSELANKNIDTGLGLERLACIMQGVDSIFEVDTIKSILEEVTKKSGVAYKNGAAPTDVSLRIITDHIRSVVFMIGDKILPSNEGRGYVLRRLLRRAARHLRLLGVKENFLYELAGKVIDLSAEAYPELEQTRAYITKIITAEEEKFATTIDQGTVIIGEYIDELKSSGNNVLAGEKVFKLYDTFGFPLELTQEILEESGFSADIDGFNENMQHQKEMARMARKNQAEEGWVENAGEYTSGGGTEFTGYEKLTDKSKIESIVVDKKSVKEINAGELGIVTLDKTPFYAESGGQATDMGTITNGNTMVEVLEVQNIQDVFIHKVKVVSGSLSVGDEVTCEVSEIRRNSIARNHTATHLLHKALREVVGEHVGQAGSSVMPDGLRFDFNHFDAVSKEDLKKIEDMVNDKIDSFLAVNTREMPLKEAMDSGAIGLFEDKYENDVRVVSADGFCMELCGGTHVANTGQIGAFKIVSEAGVAAGVRRIEAITGREILIRLNKNEEQIKETSEKIKVLPSLLFQRVLAISEESKAYKKELDELKRSEAGNIADELIADAKVINGVKLITKALDGYGVEDLRNLSDNIKSSEKGIVTVLAAENDGKVMFLVSVTDDLLEKGYHAGNMIKQIAAAAGGGGGGKADMAQAGAKDPSKINEAFKVAESLM